MGQKPVARADAEQYSTCGREQTAAGAEGTRGRNDRTRVTVHRVPANDEHTEGPVL